MCDDPGHAMFAAEISRLQEENERLESLINRPVYVTITPAYKPPDPNMTNIGANLATIAMHLQTISVRLNAFAINTTP